MSSRQSRDSSHSVLNDGLMWMSRTSRRSRRARRRVADRLPCVVLHVRRELREDRGDRRRDLPEAGGELLPRRVVEDDLGVFDLHVREAATFE